MGDISGRLLYTAVHRLGECGAWRSRPRAWLARTFAFIGLVLLTSGCGLSFPIGSLLSDDTPTGSIARAETSPLSPDLNQEDWRLARSALAVALDLQGNGSGAGWNNPESGRKGTFIPVGPAFVKNDEICRRFLASLDSDARKARLQGAACRLSGDEWVVRDVKPVTESG